MEKGTFTITLADGTQIAGLELNGNNFVSKTKITPEQFEGKLSTVKIAGENYSDEEAGFIGTFKNMQLVQIQEYEDGWYFILRTLTAAEIREMQINARLDYIEMMEDLA